jgi:hypothetical protein
MYFLPPSETAPRSVFYAGHRFTIRFRTGTMQSTSCTGTVSFQQYPYVPAGKDVVSDLANLTPAIPGEHLKRNTVFDLLEEGQVVGSGTVTTVDEETANANRL